MVSFFSNPHSGHRILDMRTRGLGCLFFHIRYKPNRSRPRPAILKTVPICPAPLCIPQIVLPPPSAIARAGSQQQLVLRMSAIVVASMVVFLRMPDSFMRRDKSDSKVWLRQQYCKPWRLNGHAGNVKIYPYQEDYTSRSILSVTTK